MGESPCPEVYGQHKMNAMTSLGVLFLIIFDSDFSFNLRGPFRIYYGFLVCILWDFSVSKHVCLCIYMFLLSFVFGSFSPACLFDFSFSDLFFFLESCLYPNYRDKGMMWIWAGEEDLGGVRGIENHNQTILYQNLFLIIICFFAFYLDTINNNLILTIR